MYHAFYAGNELLLLPILSMALFAVVFVMAAVRAWRRGPSAHVAASALPLLHDENPTPGASHE
ncbi:MAG: hypothetical protein JST54_31475 [Deltaproteobacteria bacterium]|nr:hypothetical protein [Deltaproteobacteria bacterium]